MKTASDVIHSVNEKQSLIMTFHTCSPSDTVVLSNFQDPLANKKTNLPQLFCIVLLDFYPFFHKFGVFLQEVYAPLCMLVQVIKLILKKQKEKNCPELVKNHGSTRFTHHFFISCALREHCYLGRSHTSYKSVKCVYKCISHIPEQ